MKYLIFLLLLIGTTYLKAQTRGFDGETQFEMNQNAQKEYLKTDSVLTSMYKQIIEKNKKDTLFVKNFTLAQKRWLEWRNLEIDAFFPEYPESQYITHGTMFPLCWYSKLIDWTEERMTHFKIYLNGVEFGDACGPGLN